MPGLIPIGTVEPSAVATNIVDALRRCHDPVYTDDHHAAAVEASPQPIVGSRADVLHGCL